MGVRRTTATLDVPTGKWRVDSGDPIQPENFSPDDKPELRAQQLSRVQVTVTEATTSARANRHNQALTFERVPCVAGGAIITLAHRLGRPARWAVVDWTPAASGNLWNITRDAVDAKANDVNTLTLRSYVAGSASIEVW